MRRLAGGLARRGERDLEVTICDLKSRQRRMFKVTICDLESSPADARSQFVILSGWNWSM